MSVYLHISVSEYTYSVYTYMLVLIFTPISPNAAQLQTQLSFLALAFSNVCQINF